MFFHSRRRHSLFPLLMLLFGVKFLAKERLTDTQREEVRAKAKVFRRKIREAFAVWDEEDEKSADERA